MNRLLVIFLICVAFATVAGLGAGADAEPDRSRKSIEKDSNGERDENDVLIKNIKKRFQEVSSDLPGVSTFFLICGLCLIVVGMGAMIGAATILLAASLAAMGVVSSSVFVGMTRHKPSAAALAFLIQIGGFSGALCGVACAALCDFLLEWSLGNAAIVFGGGLGGGAAGVLVAILFFMACRQLYRWIVAHFGPEETSESSVRVPAPPRVLEK